MFYTFPDCNPLLNVLFGTKYTDLPRLQLLFYSEGGSVRLPRSGGLAGAKGFFESFFTTVLFDFSSRRISHAYEGSPNRFPREGASNLTFLDVFFLQIMARVALGPEA